MFPKRLRIYFKKYNFAELWNKVLRSMDTNVLKNKNPFSSIIVQSSMHSKSLCFEVFIQDAAFLQSLRDTSRSIHETGAHPASSQI